MGNSKFRLSDMFPNAWFYKLRDMRRTTERRTTSTHCGGGGSRMKKARHPSNTNPTTPPPLDSQSPVNPRRASYYIPSRGEHKFPSSPTNPKAFDTRYLVDPPRQSKKKHRVRRSSSSLIKPSLVSEGSGRKVDEVDGDLDGLFCFDKAVIASCDCSRVTASAADIINDNDDEKGRTLGETTTQDQEFHPLPPILTKPAAAIEAACSVPRSDKKSPRRRSSAGSHGLKKRANTPRLVGKKFQAHRSSRKSTALASRPTWGVSGSFVVVKSSSDPLRDFRDSMTEMIVENNIRAAADLEELLACYLSLNSNEYHNVIVTVFQQIWFDLFDCKL